MKKLFFSIAALVILSVNSTIAQEQPKVSVGFRAGVNISTWQGKDVEGLDYATGLDFALPVEISISKNFALQPELHFIQKGSSLTFPARSIFDINFPETKIKSIVNYLELPILLKGKIGDEKLSAYAIAGPTFGYATGLYSVTKIDGKRNRESEEFEDAFNRFDVGANIGLGAELQAGRGKFVLDARYGFDFNDQLKDNEGNAVFNSGIAITVGYMVPLNL